MTIFSIFLILMTMAFVLLYPVVSMTRRFHHEFPEMPPSQRNSNQRAEGTLRENLLSLENEPMPAFQDSTPQD
jgi:hypothetical protein